MTTAKNSVLVKTILGGENSTTIDALLVSRKARTAFKIPGTTVESLLDPLWKTMMDDPWSYTLSKREFTAFVAGIYSVQLDKVVALDKGTGLHSLLELYNPLTVLNK